MRFDFDVRAGFESLLIVLISFLYQIVNILS